MLAAKGERKLGRISMPARGSGVLTAQRLSSPRYAQLIGIRERRPIFSLIEMACRRECLVKISRSVAHGYVPRALLNEALHIESSIRMRPGFTSIAVTGVRAVGLDAKGDEPCFLRRGGAKFDCLAEGVRGGIAPPLEEAQVRHQESRRGEAACAP
jgi:hypothetical protein